jgi:hypothetical protein
MLLATSPTDGQQAYVTANPARSDRLGLATQDGWYSIEPGEGCAWLGPDAGPTGDPGVVQPGVNVLMHADGDALVLQVVDPLLGVQDAACPVAEWVRVSEQPCAKNPAGDCDVAY